jgi:hypothetical protein
MPETTPPTSAAPEFVDLVCADLALLHAEFDAIVAANFPSPPPDDRLPHGETSPPIRAPAGLTGPGVNYRGSGKAGRAMTSLRRERSPPARKFASAARMRVNCHRTERRAGDAIDCEGFLPR